MIHDRNDRTVDRVPVICLLYLLYCTSIVLYCTCFPGKKFPTTFSSPRTSAPPMVARWNASW